jgi:UDPglucose 6-dehydrogenase
VAASIAQHLNGYKIIITKSTVPMGTGRMIEAIVREGAGSKHKFAVVSNPEFLREGSAIEDFMHPDRVVIGTRDERAAEMMRDVYSPLDAADVPFIVTDVETAELIKYASNGFLATKISFINEVAHICEAWGANVEVVSKGMGLDNRIGPKFLHAGPGYGGSCFPKDTQALVKTAEDHGSPMQIVEAVVRVNDERKRAMGRKIVAACGGSVKGKTIAILGLTFKPNTDDMRDAPSLDIVADLREAGASIRAYDPEGMDQARPLLEGIDYASDPYACVDAADALVIVTEWDAFRALDLDRIGTLLRTPVIIDLRNIYRPDEMRRYGFTYVSIGRDVVRAEPALAKPFKKRGKRAIGRS